jgi:hypothetical protein
VKWGYFMPILQKSIQLMGKPLPKVISPRAHTIAHYSTATLFGIAAALFWRNNKRAALASLVCGAAETGVAVMTGSRQGRRRAITPAMHRRIDLGLSTMAASMPQFLAFDHEREKMFFRTQSAVIAAVAVLTNFEPAAGIAQEQGRAA